MNPHTRHSSLLRPSDQRQILPQTIIQRDKNGAPLPDPHNLVGPSQYHKNQDW